MKTFWTWTFSTGTASTQAELAIHDSAVYTLQKIERFQQMFGISATNKSL